MSFKKKDECSRKLIESGSAIMALGSDYGFNLMTTIQVKVSLGKLIEALQGLREELPTLADDH